MPFKRFPVSARGSFVSARGSWRVETEGHPRCQGGGENMFVPMLHAKEGGKLLLLSVPPPVAPRPWGFITLEDLTLTRLGPQCALSQRYALSGYRNGVT